MSIYDKNIQIIIHDRNYSKWSFKDFETKQILDIESNPGLSDINPVEHKLFNHDVFILDNSNININIKIQESLIKSVPYLAGILVIENNKTYGRTPNKKRLLYRCIPDDQSIPAFLIPYDIKIGFSKVPKNKYIIFKYDNWNDKHPNGVIVETIGDLDNLEAFYDYKLYCKYLHISIAEFTNKTRFAIGNKPIKNYIDEILENTNYNIEDRREKHVFTIDSAKTVDFDDALGIEKMDNGWKISIYISNVFIWIETLGLWDYFSKRVATIYLPDRNRLMLPNILSDNLCSLQEYQPRFTLAMDVIVDNQGNIKHISYNNVLIQVNKNYSYEDSDMLEYNMYYNNLINVTKIIDSTVDNAHDLVAYWMTFMNTNVGMKLSEQKTGIFKTVQMNDTFLRKDVDETTLSVDSYRVISNWKNISGKYILFNDIANSDKNTTSENKLPDYYAHVTSPIRRIVDLLNHIVLLYNSNIVNVISDDAKTFLKTWFSQIEYINLSMRSIRKIQLECQLLNRYFNSTDIMNIEHEGIVFDKEGCDGKYIYMVYLEKIKLLSKIKTNINIENYSKQTFKIYLFEDEDKIRKKIRLQIII
jgi:hypothetical protein